MLTTDTATSTMPALHADAQAAIQRIIASGEPPMETLTAQQARAVADARVLKGSFAHREGVYTEEREAPGPDGAIPLRVYRPDTRDGTGPLPILIYYHGGGMVLGSIATVDPHCRWLCLELACIVVSVDYRLAPEHKFPAGALDAFHAACWVREQAAALGGDAARIAIAGESSGGTLVASVCRQLRDAGLPQPTIHVAIYPSMDAGLDWDSCRRFADGYFLTARKMQWFRNHYRRSPADAEDPRVSPVRARSFEGLAPALVITAGYDPLLDAGRAYAEKLRAAGVPVQYHCFEAWPHGYFYWGASDAAQDTMRMCIDAVRASWSRNP